MVFLFIIEHTMLPIFGLVFIGFLLDRKFHIDVKTLSKFMFYLVIPSFIFTNVYETEFPPASVTMIAAMTVFMVFCFFLANLVSRCRRYDEGMIQSCRNALMFNNTGNLGVALIILVFSHDPFVVDGQTPYLAEAMVVQIIIFIVQSVSLNTLGLYQAGRGRLSAADTLRPVAMVSIGAQLSQTKIHWFDKDVWIISLLKMTVLPLFGLIMIYAANALMPGTFTAVSAMVFLIYCAIPTAVNTALFAIEFGNNADYATQIVMNTTALSAVSLTFYIFVGHILFV